METAKTERAIFAGGCFWCSQAEFEGTDGVVSVTAGYTGGDSCEEGEKSDDKGIDRHVYKMYFQPSTNFVEISATIAPKRRDWLGATCRGSGRGWMRKKL